MRLRKLALLTACVALAIGLVAPISARATTSNRVLVFVSDGMRQDLMLQYADAGVMPTYQQVAASIRANPGMIPAVVPNSAVGWTTLFTGAPPGVTGITNNTFSDNTLAGMPGVSGFTFANNHAETLAHRAVNAGKKVTVLGEVGFDPTSITTDATNNAVVEYFPDFLSPRGTVSNFDLPLQNTNVGLALGAFLKKILVTPADATGWTNVPPNYGTPKETSFEDRPAHFFQVFIYDSTNDAAVNYDHVLISESKDGLQQVADLQAGQWSDDIPASVGGGSGQYIKLIDLTPDLSRFRLYFTPLSRVRAYPAALENDLVANFDTVPVGDDFSPYLIGLIDGKTFVEQQLMETNIFQTQIYPYILDLYQPDLAIVGNQATDSVQHRFLGLATKGSDIYDPVNAATYEGFIRDSYISSDLGLQSVLSHMSGANVLVTSDHGFSNTSSAINANLVLQNAGLFNPASPATSQARAYGAGGTAHIYINLIGRNPGGVVPANQYDAVQAAIMQAFNNLGNAVVERVYKKSETADILTAEGVRQNLLDANRTGDVVVFSAPPYQFDAPIPGFVTALTPIVGQHGFVPDGKVERYATFAAKGPALVAYRGLARVTAMDLTPTVAAILGIAPPAQSQGQVLPIVL